MPLFVSRTHGSELHASDDFSYHCEGCGYSTRVHVTVTAKGQGIDFYGLGGETARAEARLRAEHFAHRNFNLALELARCPECDSAPGRRRFAAGRNRRMALAALPGVLLLAVFAAFGASGWALVPPVLITCVGAALVWEHHQQLFRRLTRPGAVVVTTKPGVATRSHAASTTVHIVH